MLNGTSLSAGKSVNLRARACGQPSIDDLNHDLDRLYALATAIRDQDCVEDAGRAFHNATSIYDRLRAQQRKLTLTQEEESLIDAKMQQLRSQLRLLGKKLHAFRGRHNVLAEQAIGRLRSAVAAGKLKEPFREVDINRALNIDYAGALIARYCTEKAAGRSNVFVRLTRGRYRLDRPER
jgi:hypothetical protein